MAFWLNFDRINIDLLLNIIVLLSNRNNRWLLGNLAVVQFCNALTYPLVAVSNFQRIWTLGLLLCRLTVFTQGLCGMVAIGTFTMLVAANYAVVARVRNANCNCLIAAPTTNKWRIIKILLIWVYALSMTLPPLFGWGYYVMDGHLTYCSFDFLIQNFENRTYNIYLFSFGFFIPLAMICYYYIRLFTEIYRLDHARLERFQRINQLLNHPIIHNTIGKKTHALKIILVNILAFLIAWTPFAVVALIGQFFSMIPLNPAAVTIPAIFAKSSTVYMPIIFGICDPKFKRWLLGYIERYRRALINRD